jgi:hypothetical protein
MTVITGMSILGKTSVDVVAIEVNPRMRIKIAATIKVYGRFRASFTIHILRLHPKQALIPTLQEAGCEGMFETSR